MSDLKESNAILSAVVSIADGDTGGCELQRMMHEETRE